MPCSFALPSDATPRKSLARDCPKPTAAKATLPFSVPNDPIYDCIATVQAAFKHSDKEMSALLGIAQSNYTRRSYNVARVQRLPEPMRERFAREFASCHGMQVHVATPSEQVKAAAKLAIVSLLDLMEGLK